jgi:hypothetical protein
MGIIFKIMNEFYAKDEFIMDFWNEALCILHIKCEKREFKFFS